MSENFRSTFHISSFEFVYRVAAQRRPAGERFRRPTRAPPVHQGGLSIFIFDNTGGLYRDSTTGDQLKDKHDRRDDQQQMDQVATYATEQS
jgi:hypothetical protein